MLKIGNSDINIKNELKAAKLFNIENVHVSNCRICSSYVGDIHRTEFASEGADSIEIEGEEEVFKSASNNLYTCARCCLRRFGEVRIKTRKQGTAYYIYGSKKVYAINNVDYMQIEKIIDVPERLELIIKCTKGKFLIDGDYPNGCDINVGLKGMYCEVSLRLSGMGSVCNIKATCSNTGNKIMFKHKGDASYSILCVKGRIYVFRHYNNKTWVIGDTMIYSEIENDERVNIRSVGSGKTVLTDKGISSVSIETDDCNIEG